MIGLLYFFIRYYFIQVDSEPGFSNLNEKEMLLPLITGHLKHQQIYDHPLSNCSGIVIEM
jgi:hypothetical protein